MAGKCRATVANVVGAASCAMLLAQPTLAVTKVLGFFDVPFKFTEPSEVSFGMHDASSDMSVFDPQDADRVSKMKFICGCSNSAFDFKPKTSDIRALSDKHCDERSDKPHKVLTNAWWSWGQFVMHDMVSTMHQLDPLDQAAGGSTFSFTIDHPVAKTRPATMRVQRVQVEAAGKCRAPLSFQTPQIDGSHIYSSSRDYMMKTLRDMTDPHQCRLKVGPGDMPPLSEGGNPTFLTGDPRASIHAPLMAWHTLMIRAHNWVCDDIQAHFDGRMNQFGRPYFVGFSKEDRMMRAKNVTAAWMTQLTKQWLAAFTKIGRIGSAKPRLSGPELSVEFAAVVARTFDDAVPNKIGSESMSSMIPAERYFGVGQKGTYVASTAMRKLDSLFETLASTPANEMDGKFSDAVRNTVFGSFGFDLATTHIFRGRELGVKPYRDLANCFGLDYQDDITVQDPWLAMAMESGSDSRQRDLYGMSPLAHAIMAEQFKRSLFSNDIVPDWTKMKDVCCKGYVQELLKPQSGHLIKLLTGADVPDDVFTL